MIERVEPLRFAILKDPPTVEQINRERERLTLAVAAHKKRKCVWVVVLALAAIFAVAAAYVSWGLLDTVKIVIAPGLLFCIVLLPEILRSETDEEHDIRRLEPISSGFWCDLIEACRLDPKADAYRMKVVNQGRGFVVAEGHAFSAWKTGQGSTEWALVHSRQSITPVESAVQRTKSTEIVGS